MDDVFVILLMGLAGVLVHGGLYAVALVFCNTRTPAQAWRRTAEAAGLTSVKLWRRYGLVSEVCGRAEPLQVRLREYVANGARHTRVTLSGLGHGGQIAFGEVKLGPGPRWDRPPVAAIAMGDALFEERVQLRGSSELACAVFTARNRALVLQLVQGCLEGPGPPLVGLAGSAWMAGGTLEVNVAGPATRIGKALPGLIAIARGLARPPDLVERLAENLRDDPVAGVRLANLRQLLEGHAGHPRTEEAMLAALGDPSEEIRLQAALTLGERGHSTLLAIACSDQSDDGRAARAIAALGQRLPSPQVQALLEQALVTRRLATAGACIEALGRDAGGEAVDRLKCILATEEWVLAAAAARALGASGNASGEPALIEALNGAAPEVMLAVADALAQVGTAAAVMPLREAAHRLRDTGFQRAALQAVAAIQSRLRWASPGQLSAPSSEAGQVSLLEDAQGQLSEPFR